MSGTRNTGLVSSSNKSRMTKVFPGLNQNFRDEELERFHEELHGERGSGELSFRERLEYVLATSSIGMTVDLLHAVVSLLSCALYIGETYVIYDSVARWTCTLFDTSFSTIFLLDYLLHFFVAQKRVAFFFSIRSIMDILTIIPGFALFYIRSQSWYDPNLLKVEYSVLTTYNLMRVCRIFRCMRITRLLSFIDSEVLRQVYAMSLQVLCLIYFTSGIVQLMENTRSFWPPLEEYKELTFFDVIYLVVTTITTVGYGDVAPVTVPGRAVIMFMMCATLILVPRQTNKLIALMGMTSVYARQSYKLNPQSSHVVVAGEVFNRGIVDFFRELFHPDHGNPNLRAVIIGDGLPSAEIRGLLSDPRLAYMITYLDGNVMSDKDLLRASVDHAEAVFLLTNKYSNSPAQDDASCILRALSIQRFIHKCRQHKKRSKRGVLCLQLIQSESRKLFASTSKQGSGSDQFINQLICIDEIKMNILAKSCLVPGLITLINNLIASSDDSASHRAEEPWIDEYEQGIGYEIYRVELSKSFEGLTFGRVAQIVYEATGTLVFALELTHIAAGSHVSLNPSNFIIPPANEELGIFVFVLAGDLQEALAVKSKDIYKATNMRTQTLKLNSSKFFSRVLSKVGSSSSGPQKKTIGQTSFLENSVLDDGGDLEVESIDSKQGDLQNAGKRKTWRLWNSARLSFGKKEASQRALLLADHYVLDEPADFDEIYVHSIPSEFPPSLEGHIIVAGSPATLYHFILPLRSRKLARPIPIFIMHTTIPTPSEWQPLSTFQEVYFVKGSLLDVHDLARVKISAASRVVIFAKHLQTKNRYNEALVDADTIFAYSILQKENPNIQVIVELVAQSNISYISDTDQTDRTSAETGKYVYAPPFAAGNIYTSSMLDTLLGQAFYNQKLITILQQLVVGQDKELASLWLRQANLRGVTEIPSSDLYLIQVPEAMVGKTFKTLLSFLIKDQILPIALRRGVNPSTRKGERSNFLPYVVTNPSQDLVVEEWDSVFVLSEQVLVSDLNSEARIYQDDVSTANSASKAKELSKTPSSHSSSKSPEPIYEKSDPGDAFNDTMSALKNEMNAELRELSEGIKLLMKKVEGIHAQST